MLGTAAPVLSNKMGAVLSEGTHSQVPPLVQEGHYGLEFHKLGLGG